MAVVVGALVAVGPGCGRRGGGGGGGGRDGGARDAPSSTCSGTCEECIGCAETSPMCAPARAACMDDGDCTAFIVCAGESDDPMVVSMCRTMHPTGATLYCDYFACALYDVCDAPCSGGEPSVVCPP